MSYEEEKQDRKIEQLEAEIERLRAEMENYGDDYVCQMKSKDARIQELEEALVDCRYAPQPNGYDDWGNPIILSVSGGAYTGTTRSWQITEERIWLLEYCLETLLDAPDIEEIPGPGHSIEMLRAMLREAEQ